MKLYDLTHRLNNESPVYPGISSPQFTATATIEKNGYRETHFRFHSHLGTHIDAPAHMLKDGLFLNEMNIDSFLGQALIISVSSDVQIIGKDILVNYKESISKTDFVLFKTGWSRYWGEEEYFGRFPVLNSEATEYLLSFKLKGIGFDVISVDPMESNDYKNHYSIFEKGLIIIENLVFPESLKEATGEFSCFPLKYEKADGSPVRAIFRVD
ncbi:cyclase family protein [Maribellus comscasis]|uniref:Cyclase family protein n=1 Tax=Maribellus comscasis TaxID=2681766 RepID=A0A6I6KAC6_9BACT|nr:cyclase family protein [Maribellus comscasis]QGY47124.1 cyclase family protein [Maribellus comscasis]